MIGRSDYSAKAIALNQHLDIKADQLLLDETDAQIGFRSITAGDGSLAIDTKAERNVAVVRTAMYQATASASPTG